MDDFDFFRSSNKCSKVSKQSQKSVFDDSSSDGDHNAKPRSPEQENLFYEAVGESRSNYSPLSGLDSQSRSSKKPKKRQRKPTVNKRTSAKHKKTQPARCSPVSDEKYPSFRGVEEHELLVEVDTEPVDDRYPFSDIQNSMFARKPSQETSAPDDCDYFAKSKNTKKADPIKKKTAVRKPKVTAAKKPVENKTETSGNTAAVRQPTNVKSVTTVIAVPDRPDLFVAPSTVSNTKVKELSIEKSRRKQLQLDVKLVASTPLPKFADRLGPFRDSLDVSKIENAVDLSFVFDANHSTTAVDFSNYSCKLRKSIQATPAFKKPCSNIGDLASHIHTNRPHDSISKASSEFTPYIPFWAQTSPPQKTPAIEEERVVAEPTPSLPVMNTLLRNKLFDGFPSLLMHGNTNAPDTTLDSTNHTISIREVRIGEMLDGLGGAPSVDNLSTSLHELSIEEVDEGTVMSSSEKGPHSEADVLVEASLVAISRIEPSVEKHNVIESTSRCSLGSFAKPITRSKARASCKGAPAANVDLSAMESVDCPIRNTFSDVIKLDNPTNRRETSGRKRSSIFSDRSDNPLDSRKESRRRLSVASVPQGCSTGELIRRVMDKSGSSVVADTSLLSLLLPDLPLSSEEKVLRLCNPPSVVDFKTCFPPKLMKSCKKIGEGSYGEVFCSTNERGEGVALKIICVGGDVEVNGSAQLTFEGIISELVVSHQLNLFLNPDVNVCQNFIKLNRLNCVRGKFPKGLQTLWNKFDAEFESLNTNPSTLPSDQLYLVLETSLGGKDLEKFEFSKIGEAVSVFQQVALALAIAEKEHKFEHRDLHWGNILVSRAIEQESNQELRFVLNGMAASVEHCGVKVDIIDFSLSRITNQDGVSVYNDLSADECIFEGDEKEDIQFAVYRQMRDETRGDWEGFYPRTNLLWLRYLAEKLMTKKCSNSRKGRASLMSYRSKVMDYDSTSQFVIEELSSCFNLF